MQIVNSADEDMDENENLFNKLPVSTSIEFKFL